MKRTTSTLAAAGILLITVAGSGSALAQDYYMGPRHMMGPGMMGHGPMHYGPYGGPYGHRGMMGHLSYLAEELELSDEQRKSIRDILDKTRAQARDLGDEMGKVRDQMDDLLDDKGYGADFDKLARREGELIGQMIILRAKTHAQIEGVLTPEQKERLRDYGDDFDEYGPGYGWRGHRW